MVVVVIMKSFDCSPVTELTQRMLTLYSLSYCRLRNVHYVASVVMVWLSLPSLATADSTYSVASVY